jgi:hypothetical protein
MLEWVLSCEVCELLWRVLGPLSLITSCGKPYIAKSVFNATIILCDVVKVSFITLGNLAKIVNYGGGRFSHRVEINLTQIFATGSPGEQLVWGVLCVGCFPSHIGGTVVLSLWFDPRVQVTILKYWLSVDISGCLGALGEFSVVFPSGERRARQFCCHEGVGHSAGLALLKLPSMAWWLRWYDFSLAIRCGNIQLPVCRGDLHSVSLLASWKVINVHG